MRRRVVTAGFIRAYAAFLRKHPDLEKKVEEVIDTIALKGRVAGSHALHGKLGGYYSARITQQYRLAFALAPETVTFVDIGSHDEVY